LPPGHVDEAAVDVVPGAPDDEMLARSVASGQNLVTADMDFGELVYRLRRVQPGVVLLRLAGLSTADRAETVSAVFRDRAGQLPGNFTVIEPDIVRVRRPPVAS
jgi:predicted nuclease of predicted toxin-antitoxin system